MAASACSGESKEAEYLLNESNSDSSIYNVNIRKAIRAVIDSNAALLAVCGGSVSYYWNNYFEK